MKHFARGCLIIAFILSIVAIVRGVDAMRNTPSKLDRRITPARLASQIRGKSCNVIVKYKKGTYEKECAFRYHFLFTGHGAFGWGFSCFRDAMYCMTLGNYSEELIPVVIEELRHGSFAIGTGDGVIPRKEQLLEGLLPYKDKPIVQSFIKEIFSDPSLELLRESALKFVVNKTELLDTALDAYTSEKPLSLSVDFLIKLIESKDQRAIVPALEILEKDFEDDPAIKVATAFAETKWFPTEMQVLFEKVYDKQADSKSWEERILKERTVARINALSRIRKSLADFAFLYGEWKGINREDLYDIFPAFYGGGAAARRWIPVVNQALRNVEYTPENEICERISAYKARYYGKDDVFLIMEISLTFHPSPKDYKNLYAIVNFLAFPANKMTRTFKSQIVSLADDLLDDKLWEDRLANAENKQEIYEARFLLSHASMLSALLYDLNIKDPKYGNLIKNSNPPYMKWKSLGDKYGLSSDFLYGHYKLTSCYRDI